MPSWFLLPLLFAQTDLNEAARLFEAGKFAEAASDYQTMLKANPNSAEAWAGLGRAALRLGHPPEAVMCLRKALQLQPADAVFEFALARAYLDGGDAPSAIALLETLAAKEADNAEFRRLYGEAMYRGGYYAHALQLLEPPAGDHPMDRQAAGMYAVSLAKTGRTAEAEAALKRLLNPSAAPLDLDVVLTYVEILDEAGRSAEALVYANLAVGDQPANPIAHLWKARLLWHSDHAEDAAREAEQSVSLAPTLPFARNLLLQIDRKLGRVDDARRQADWLREYNDRLAARGHE